jgi:PKD repeat protein
VISAHPSVQLYGVTIDGVAKGSYAFLSSTGAYTLSFGGEISPGRRSNGEAWWDDILVTGFVYVPPLQASASATPTSGPAPLTVSFTATASGGVPPYTYIWIFGDGGGAPIREVSHTYTTPNTYTALLIVSDSAANRVTWNTTITVLSAPVPVFSDNFDDGSISDWTMLRTGTGKVEATSVRSHSSPYSLHVYYAGPFNLGRATTKAITCNFAVDYTISLWFYRSSTSSDKEIVVVDDGRVKVKDYLGTLKASTPAGEITIGTISQNVWHEIVLKAHPSTQNYEVIIDSVSKGTFAFLSSGGTNTLSMGGEVTPGKKSLGEAWWDDITVTGYAT